MSLYEVGTPVRAFPLCPRCYNDPRSEWGQSVNSDVEVRGYSDDEDGERKKKETIGERASEA